MNTSPKVYFKNVSKKYSLQQRKVDKILEVLLSRGSSTSFYALRNVSFTVNQGETIGIIGMNGSGKSTLSNLLAQVVPPTSGSIKVNGETSLIAISVGLNNNLTGLDNIELKCLMHGLKKEEIKRITPLIIEFADLGAFINQPVKNYSSGMKSRLGFAISVHTNPDILIIDEALSVGDQTFYEKCIKKMNEFKNEGKTIFFISHSVSQVRSFCDKVMWIHYGELVEYGDAKTVLASYSKFVKFFTNLTDEEQKKYKKERMAKQQNDDPPTPNEEGTSRRNRSVKKNKKGRKRSFFQLSIMFAALFLSTFLMLFEGDPLKGLALKFKAEENKIDSKTINVNNDIEKPEAIDINKDGYIKTEQSSIYQNQDLQNTITTLKFSDQVFIEKKVGDVYEFTLENQKVYLEEKDIYIPEGEIVQNNLLIESFLEGFPTSFRQSYNFYLAFINSDADEIEGKVRGKTSEYNDEHGNKYLVFNNIEYRITSDNVSNAIIVKDFDFNNINTEQIIENATIKSDDNSLIYVLTGSYKYIFDFKNQTVTII